MPAGIRLLGQVSECVTNKDEMNVVMSKKKKKCRRSMVNKNHSKPVTIMYANIQGIRGKMASLKYVMSTCNADIVLLTETMTRNVKIDGCQCINPKTSVGQNVSIILKGKCSSNEKMKLFEPNETINMMGLRVEICGMALRIYTAHLKQQSTNSRDDIKVQFEEIRMQFRSAQSGREPMLIICDANVHLGGGVIKGCGDVQDWGGKELWSMIEEEGLSLINAMEKCSGVVTRVDPRNGSESTLDLAICNGFMVEKVSKMVIDEEGELKLKNYGKKVTESDHNTITMDINVTRSKKKITDKMVKYNTRNADGRNRMKTEISNDLVINSLFNDSTVDVGTDVEKLLNRWERAMKNSFHIVKVNKHTKPGVDHELKSLLDEEKLIRRTILNNPERGRKLAEIQKTISGKIAQNVMGETESKVNKIIQSDRPQSKVFHVRRKVKEVTNIDFPLKDKNGVMQVSKEGIDKIITNHFTKVFAQNEVPKESLWQEYWSCVDEVFALIDEITKNEYNPDDEPRLEEIEKIVTELKESKASYGPMTIDLVKLCSSTMTKVIYRCILLCFRRNVFPEKFQIEKMTLLLKNRGLIDNINDYRGIFLRNVIVSVYQKWLYSKNAPTVDSNGTEYAIGGRKERAGIEALLIVKLVQDYARWTKTPIILKFLDVEKFFDSMNFKKSLIEAYSYGIKGRFWQCYKTINQKRKCIPHIPSGECSPIEMDQIFVQGSCDAVLMAWPIMDTESKKRNDPFTVDCCINGIPINQLSFVDDLLQATKSSESTEERTLSDEIFERKTRLNYKTSKCKIMPMNCSRKIEIYLDGEIMEVVDDHVYLGSIISIDGQRVKDMVDRIKKSKCVANEIVQICKETELAMICLRYVKILLNACLDNKVKYGSALWDLHKSKKSVDDLNRMKPNVIKRVLQLPSSTPSDAVQYDFGINDLTLDVMVEKLVLAVETWRNDDNRVAKQLFQSLMEKNVNGFCTEVLEVCKIFNISFEELLAEKDIRTKVKSIVVKIQEQELYKRMLVSSKMDGVLINGFSYDGKVKKYLLELDFVEARAIFMARYRMLPTKANFPGRWSGTKCNICGFADTDEHIFHCPGYQDLLCKDMYHNMFWEEEVLNDTAILKKAACSMLGIIERLNEVQEMKDLEE